MNSFVGRERELAELKAALDQTLRGNGRMFLVSGEPGIGKTTLAAELAEEASSRGLRTVWGRCWEGDGAPAYWPWTQVIRGLIDDPGYPPGSSILSNERCSSALDSLAQIVPELRRPGAKTPEPQSLSGFDAEQARFKLFDSLATLLKSFARVSPLLIIIDDLHDADEASLATLRFVARELKATPLLIIGTYRDLEVRRSAELSEQIGKLGREAHSIPLAGLSRGEVAEFIARNSQENPQDELVGRLHAATAGNPLFVDGVVRMLGAEEHGDATQARSNREFKLPVTVNEAIRLRLAVLSNEARGVLNIAAVIGNEFDSNLLAKVGQLARHPLTALIAEGAREGLVISLGGDRTRFAHALVRGAIYAQLDADRRERLHREIAQAIEELYRQKLDPHVAELAHHYGEANVRPKAIQYCLRAGKASLRVGANADAVAHLEAALTAMEAEGNDAQSRADLLKLLGIAVHPIDQPKSITFREAAIELYESAGLWRQAATTRVMLGRYFAVVGQPISNTARAIDQLRRAEPILASGPETSELAWLYDAIAASEQQRLNLPASRAAAQHGMAIAERLGDRQAWSSLAAFSGYAAAFCGDLTQAFALFDRSFAAADEADRPGSGHAIADIAASICSWLGDPRAARLWHERELSRPRNAHDLWIRRQHAVSTSIALAQQWQLGELRRVMGSDHHTVRFWVGGEWEAIAELNERQAEWSEHANDRVSHLSSSISAGFSFLLLGEYARAEAHLRYGLNNGDGGRLVIYEMRARPLLALVYCEMGRVDDAASEVARCREIMAAGEDWRGSAGLAAVAEAVVAAIGGDFAFAWQQFHSGLAIHRRYHQAEWEAQTLRYWGRALATAGDLTGAAEKFDSAIKVCHAHGVGPRFIDYVTNDKERALAAASARTASSASRPGQSTQPIVSNAFLREGEYWTITYEGPSFRLRSIKGLGYLAHLIGHPGEQFHVTDLAALVQASAGGNRTVDDLIEGRLTLARDLDGAPPSLDATARADYRTRIKELDGELDEADRFNDTGRAAKIRAELDALKDELGARLGIGGRPRKTGSHAERARLMVGNNIRSAIAKISGQSPSLGRYLSTTIRTGYFCSYQPDPDHPVVWQL